MKEVFEKIKERLEEEEGLAEADKARCLRKTPTEHAFAKGYATAMHNAIEIVNQVAEEYNEEHNTDAKTVLEILDKFEMFQGQRAGRELWGEKPDEVQDRDIEHFNRDLNIIRSYIKRSTAYYNDGWIPVSSGKMPENGRRCWVTYEWANGSLHVDKDYLVNGKWFETEDEAVKAWMYNDEETPAPYQPKGESK